ncbi:MAG: hypothetical protein WAN99_05120 [Methanoculleus sp.]
MWAVPNDRDRPVKKWRRDLPRGQGITALRPYPAPVKVDSDPCLLRT